MPVDGGAGDAERVGDLLHIVLTRVVIARAWRARVSVILNFGAPFAPSGFRGGQSVLRPLDDQVVPEFGDRGEQVEEQPAA